MTWGAAGWSPLVEPRHDGARAAAGACRGDAARVGGRAGGGGVLTRLSASGAAENRGDPRRSAAVLREFAEP